MQLHNFSFKAMGSLCEIKIYTNTQTQAADIAHSAITLINTYQAKYTRFQSDSLTSKINAAAGTGKAVSLDEETVKLVRYADTLYQQSEGLFDISSGVLRRAWDFKSNQCPTAKQLENILPLVGWDNIQWSDTDIYLPIKGMEIDFGGYVKEYIADIVANHCFELGIAHGLINLGGDIKIIGAHPDNTPWQVGIQHPRQAKTAIATVELRQGGIATSGDYERYMMINKTRYCHILNPKTGQSIHPFYAGISVAAQDCLIAGSFTTLALIKSETDPNWILELELPHLTVDQQLHLRGSLA